jgi:hypothetical protein
MSDTTESEWVLDWPDEAERRPPEPCPRCGSHNTYAGYGLMGGGIGAYRGCDACDWFEKTPDPAGEV